MTRTEHGDQDWTGRTVRGDDGGALGRLTRVLPATGAGAGWGEVRSRWGRRRLVPLDGADPRGGRDLTVPVDRASVRTAPAPPRGGAVDPAAESALRHHYTGRGVLADARTAQRERFGGIRVGAAFFGWLVAVGMTVLLGAITGGVGAAGASVAEVAPTGFAALAAALVVLLLAYYTGGYVSGRLARFDGARNGALCWLIGILVTVAVAAAAGVLGPDLAARSGVALPTPVVLPGADGLTLTAVVTLAVAVLGTMIAAMLGGRAGEAFHRRVDRAGSDAVSDGRSTPVRRTDDGG